MHKYSFCESNLYCVNKPCIIFFYFFFISSTAKSLIKHRQWRSHKRKVNLNTSTYLIKRRDNKYFPVRFIKDRKQLSNSRIMQVLLIFPKKILDKYNDEVSPEFKVKIKRCSCQQRKWSHLFVQYINM